MKIAFVYDAVYPWIKGGGEKRIYELGRRLAKEGHEVHVFGVKWWDGPSVMKYEGMMLHGVCRAMDLYVGSRRSIPEAMIFAIKLVPHLIREKFDMIDVTAFPYFSCISVKFVSIIRGTPMIITWLEVWGKYWYEYLGFAGYPGIIIEKICTKLPDKHITISQHTREELLAIGVPARKTTVIRIGINFKLIQQISPNKEKYDIVFAGRLIQDKNVDVLIEAVGRIKKQLKEIKCIIIGSGPEKEKLVALANDLCLGENIRFMDFMEYEEMISFIKSSRLFVLPSTREGFGIIVLEVMASRTPVIAVISKRSAVSEIIDNENGLLCSLDELPDNMIEVLTNEKLRQGIIEKGFDYSMKFDWETIIEGVLNFYKRR